MRLIEPEQLKAAVRANYGSVLDAVLICRFIDDYAEAVDAEPVKHGHWMPVRGRWNDVKNYKCSLCNQLGGGKYADTLPRCPHCGAKMDEEMEEKND